MIKVLCFLFFLCFHARALVPVEGILMGEAREDIQTDPLKMIFRDIYDKSLMRENKKIKLYQGSFESGQILSESCGQLGPSVYSTPWMEKQARRSVAATLQLIGLDTTIKAIGAYARKLEMPKERFKILKTNLVRNYCSKNVTVMSLRNIEKSLEYYFKNPESLLIPSITSSPFSPEKVKEVTEKDSARSKEFDLVIRNFRAFCSWGNEVEDYRLLTPYLNNRFIMAFIFKNLRGVQDQVDEKELKVVSRPSEATVQVTCTDLICRKDTPLGVSRLFPLSIGSTGLATDLAKLYCHHFRYLDPPAKSAPQIKTWLKADELEDPIFETSQFIALMTGVPDFMNSVETYREIPLLTKSSIDERWTSWANATLNTFSRDLLFEESFKVKINEQNDPTELALNGFRVDLSVTLGEMDRILKDNDKISMNFDLMLSKNYLRMIKTRSLVLDKAVDVEGRRELRSEVAKYLNIQLKEKEKLLNQKMWNEDFSRLLAEELIRQANLYRGPLFETYQDEVLRIPVNFSYGLFALSYLKYRADVAAGRLKLKL